MTADQYTALALGLLAFLGALVVALAWPDLARCWWAAWTRREPPPDEAETLARRLVSEARMRQHARLGGLTVTAFGRRYVLSDATGTRAYPNAAQAEDAVARYLRGTR